MECVWAVQFNVRKGKLDMLLIQRSVDSALGLPYNWSGYYSILLMLAQVTGYKVGEFTHQMGNIHYYDRHEELLLKQVQGEAHEQPTVIINPEIKDFFDFTPSDYKVENYKHNGKFEYEVAI
jgi:thymidylate synthase